MHVVSSADEYLDEHVADECGLDVGWREADLSRLANRERQVWDERREVLEVFGEAHEVLVVVQRANARVQLLRRPERSSLYITHHM